MFDFLLADEKRKRKKKSPAVFILTFRIQTQTQICAELYILLSTIQDQNAQVPEAVDKYC